MTSETKGLPLVTIGIPAFDCGPFVGAAIASALAQDHPNFEVLVIDDASTDDTLAVVRSFDDPRLRVIANDHNVGMAENHNRVLAEARGEFTKILHADDVIEPDAVRLQAAALSADPQIALVSSRRRIIDDLGKPIVTRGPSWPEGRIAAAEVLRSVARAGSNLIGEPSAVLFRTATAREAGGFSTGELYLIDLEFYARMLGRGDLYFIPRPLTGYRVRSDNATARYSGGPTADMERFLKHLQADPDLGITDADIAEGMRRASRDYRMRRVFVSVFSIPGTHRERIAFLLAGGWNTAFGYGVFAALWWAFGALWPYWVVLGLSYAISTVMSFVTQKFLVFRSSGSVWAEFPRFASVYAGVLALNLFAFPALMRWLGLNPYVSQLVFTAAVVVFSYTANKYFSFREPA